MKKTILLFVILVCSFSISAQTQSSRTPKDNSQILPIRRVILYSNGVAYIERRGVISGNAEINLSFKQSQVDDVLKSMVVLDLGKGRIGAVSYNSSAPPSAKMAEIPFSVAAETRESGGIAGVLAQLQGARVAVTSKAGTATGSILTVEKRQVTNEKITTTSTFLVVASENGEISNFDLADVRSVKLLDEGTRRDVNEFANATASTRRRDAKTITVTSNGNGQREMLVSYIIAAPIWKTTYRVVLDKEGKPFFQGWAIVDNVSDEDWENVQLSLVSGSPISFIQQIQKPFYRYRPVVPIPGDLNLTPQIYEASETSINQRQVGELPKGSGFGNGSGSGLRVAPNVVGTESNKSGYQVDGASGAENTFLVDGQEQSNFSVGDAVTGENSGVQTAATGDEIGDLFQYKIEQPVTVMRDRSALIPIVQTKMEGERISIYNQAVRQNRPLSGLRLNNITNLTLESGSLTVIDGDAYAGEALMERLKAKEQRLISYALDLGTHIRVRQDQDREPTNIVKVVNGVFQVNYFKTDEKRYQITNQTDRSKVLYIEYPIRIGWELTKDSPKPDYSTQRYHRFRVELEPFEEKEITISEKQELIENYKLTSLSRNDLSLFISKRYINDKTRSKLEKLIDLRSRINLIDSKLGSFDTEINSISDDQKRLRENIAALSKTAEAKSLISRYIEKVNQQETRLEQITKERRDLEAEKSKLERELATEIREFEIIAD